MAIEDVNDSTHRMTVLAEMIDSISVVMLTARRSDGLLVSMPMARVRVPFDGTVLLFGDPMAATVVDLSTNANVNLSHAEVSQCRYVSLSGVVEAVHDLELAQKLWKPDYREWLPRGLQDPLHGLYRVTVQHAEYWDAAHSAMRQIGGLMKGLFTGNRPSVGDHESINLTEKIAEP